MISKMLALTLLTLSACPGGGVPGGVPSPDALDKICAHESVDASSTFALARDDKGAPMRILATASDRTTNLSPLIFDLSGAFLGHDYRYDLPEERAAEEKARVAALMAGAVLDTDSLGPLCP